MHQKTIMKMADNSCYNSSYFILLKAFDIGKKSLYSLHQKKKQDDLEAHLMAEVVVMEGCHTGELSEMLDTRQQVTNCN